MSVNNANSSRVRVPPPPMSEPAQTTNKTLAEPPSFRKPPQDIKRGNTGPPRSFPPNESKERIVTPKSSPPPGTKESVLSSSDILPPIANGKVPKNDNRPKSGPQRTFQTSPNQNPTNPTKSENKEKTSTPNPSQSPPNRARISRISQDFDILPPKDCVDIPPPLFDESLHNNDSISKSATDPKMSSPIQKKTSNASTKTPTQHSQIETEIVDFSTPKARRAFNYDLAEPNNFKSLSDVEKRDFLKKRFKHLQEIKDDITHELQKIESTFKTVNEDLSKVYARIQDQEKKDKDKKDKKAVKEAKDKAKKDHKEHKDKKKAKGSSPDFKIFGKPLNVILEREHSTVPRFIKACCEFISKKSTLQTEGIFRLSVVQTQLESLQREIEESGQYNFDELPESKNDPFIVPCLLKKFFREMPEPLIPFDCYTCFISAAGVENDVLREKKYKDVIEMFLPESNRIVLKYLFEFLFLVQKESEYNKMSYGNLGTCFGPSLLRDNAEYDLMTESLLISTIIANLIERNDYLFSGETSG